MMVQLDIFLRISFMLSRDCDEPGTPVLAPVSAPAPAPLARTLGLPVASFQVLRANTGRYRSLRNDFNSSLTVFSPFHRTQQLLQECSLHDLFSSHKDVTVHSLE